MTAAENGHLAVCDYLIRQGAQLDSIDVEGRYYGLGNCSSTECPPSPVAIYGL